MSFVVDILYFASVREAMDCDMEKIELAGATARVSDLVVLMATQNKKFLEVQSAGVAPLLVSVNQELATSETAISEGDEVAFFPPMTGG
jgi:molybdopterin synthase sulfur carrier subunit